MSVAYRNEHGIMTVGPLPHHPEICLYVMRGGDPEVITKFSDEYSADRFCKLTWGCTYPGGFVYEALRENPFETVRPEFRRTKDYPV